eukprot:scaffold8105_cov112-Isochrysis_galbana.AAC.3
MDGSGDGSMDGSGDGSMDGSGDGSMDGSGDGSMDGSGNGCVDGWVTAPCFARLVLLQKRGRRRGMEQVGGRPAAAQLQQCDVDGRLGRRNSEGHKPQSQNGASIFRPGAGSRHRCPCSRAVP